MIARIVPAEAWHVDAIAANARDADVAELWACSRSNPAAAMRRGLASTVNPYTGMVDGVPVAMFGVSPFDIMLGWGTAWMIGSKALDRLSVQKALLAFSGVVVDQFRYEFPGLLFNYVDQRNTKAIRWLAWMGFKFEQPIPYGVDRLPFLPFYQRGA